MTGFTSLMDMHCELSVGYEEMTFAERHLPYSKFRKNVSDLRKHVGELLNDTLMNFLINHFLQSESHYPYRESDNISAIFNGQGRKSEVVDGDNQVSFTGRHATNTPFCTTTWCGGQ